MGIFKDRSDFFKTRAIKSKKIAHTVEVDGEVRNTFLRLNDEEELQSAFVNYAHSPCMVHFGFDGRYSSNIGAVAKRRLSNDVLILSKGLATDMDSIENAYDESFEILEELLSWMNNEYEINGSCGPFSSFDLSRCSFVRYSINSNWFGWLLSFEDEVYAKEVTRFDASKWFE
jgi:hypothetical protein